MVENPLRVVVMLLGLMLIGTGAVLLMFLFGSRPEEQAVTAVIGFGMLIGGLTVVRFAFTLPDDTTLHDTATITDGYIGAFLPGAPVPTEEHAAIAADNAGNAGTLFQLHIMDVGISASIPEGAPIKLYLTAPVPHDAPTTQPFVAVYARYPQRGALELRLFDDDAEEQYNHHEVIDLPSAAAIRVVGDDFTPPLEPSGEWVLGVYFNDTLIALHPVYWTEASP